MPIKSTTTTGWVEGKGQKRRQRKKKKNPKESTKQVKT